MAVLKKKQKKASHVGIDIKSAGAASLGIRWATLQLYTHAMFNRCATTCSTSQASSKLSQVFLRNKEETQRISALFSNRLERQHIGLVTSYKAFQTGFIQHVAGLARQRHSQASQDSGPTRKHLPPWCSPLFTPLISVALHLHHLIVFVCVREWRLRSLLAGVGPTSTR